MASATASERHIRSHSAARPSALLSAIAEAVRRFLHRHVSLEFTVEVEADELDGGYIAECVELPGCMSQGETEEEALENIVDAITGVLSTRMQAHVEAISSEVTPPKPPVGRRSVAIPVP